MNKVSVIMNSYNESENLFKRSVENILKNKNVDVELIVSTVDNDNCLNWISDNKIKIATLSKPGIFEQINNSINLITGDFVTYASSNDIMHDDKLFIESEILKKTKKKVCYSSFYKIDISKNQSLVQFHDYNFEKHLKRNFVSDCAMVLSETFKKYSPFKLKYGNHAFHDLWLRIYKHEGNVFIYNNIPTWTYVITEDSSHQKRLKDKEKYTLNEISRKKMISDHIII